MVEIIPKPAPKLSSWQNILFYLSFGLILLAVFSYFVADIYLGKAEAQLEALKQKMDQTKTAEEISLEQELSSYEKKIQSFSVLINRHLFSSKTFEFIEKNTHPEVWFSTFNLDPKKGGVALSGDTENFVTLHQQIQIFETNPSVKDLNLAGIAIGKEGRIAFDLNLIFDLGLFKLNE
ncbi:MAG TPA: hypothetical protein VMV66_02295 [Candidatus Humimicrobiaceae bacterium]|nr:hypothetical protein [Candidatus Humimicrobiaceae bacterium]